MKRKSNSYHLDVQTHRKNPYGLLRNSYREDGKVKKETICRFSGLSLEQLRVMQAAIQGRLVPKEELKITNSREYGASYVCYSILRELELHKAIHSQHSQEWVKSSIAMIIGRLVYQGSKLSLSHASSYTSLWEVCKVEGDIDVNIHCYDAMDKIYARQDAIQKALAKKHLQNGVLVLYDITSSYMDGEYADSEIVAFGYSRDKKRGKQQIVISLLCNKDGCPVAVEVFKGNTKDETTILDQIEDLQKKYGIEKVVITGDRGMITHAKYEEINHETVKVISTLKHNKIKELCDNGIIQMSLFDEKEIAEVFDGEHRYMLCKNPIMAEKEAKTREKLLKLTTDELDKIIASTRKTKNPKPIRAVKVVNKYKMAKFITFEGKDNNPSYKVDDEKVKKEAALDGCYVVFTDVSKEDTSAYEAVESYKSLMQVEQTFRNLKTAHLEMRPVFHKTDDRIKCHVFICMLAYYIMWHMQQRLKPLTEIDGVGSKRKYTFDYCLECLKSIRYEDVSFLNATTNMVSTPTDEQAHLLNLLNVAV